MTKNLNKEDFWRLLKEKFPESVEMFCKWIDEYKKEVRWNKLFNAVGYSSEYGAVAPKFHDIPYEMQIGIVFKFLSDHLNWEYFTVEITKRKNTINYISTGFHQLEDKIKSAKQ